MQLLWKTVCRVLQKLKIELPYDPAMPPLDIYPKKIKTLIWKKKKKYIHPSVHSSTLFTTAKTWTQPKCPSTGEWKKMYLYSLQINIRNVRGATSLLAR